MRIIVCQETGDRNTRIPKGRWFLTDEENNLLDDRGTTIPPGTDSPRQIHWPTKDAAEVAARVING